MDAMIVVAVVVAGIAGCLATALLARVAGGLPFSVIAGNPYKYVWSVIYALPVPLLLAGLGLWVGGLVAWLWLTTAPPVGVKAYFGPMERTWAELIPLHALSYAPATLFAYLLLAP